MNAQQQIDLFIDKFTPEVAALCRELLAKMKARVPGATIMAYDNYNALAIGFGPSSRASDAILSLAVMPRWVLLYFLKGASLADPRGLLRGKGTRGRHIRLLTVGALDEPGIDDLIDQALAAADPPIDPNRPGELVIKSISAKQRPRRPKA